MLERKDIVWIGIRAVIYAAVVYEWGLLYGAGILFVVNTVIDYFLLKALGLESCNAMDKLFLLDDPTNRSIITSAISFKRFDAKRALE